METALPPSTTHRLIGESKQSPPPLPPTHPYKLPFPAPAPLEFHENHGRNLQLKNGAKSASRTDSYNQVRIYLGNISCRYFA